MAAQGEHLAPCTVNNESKAINRKKGNIAKPQQLSINMKIIQESG